jgi:hypothetical protein
MGIESVMSGECRSRRGLPTMGTLLVLFLQYLIIPNTKIVATVVQTGLVKSIMCHNFNLKFKQ